MMTAVSGIVPGKIRKSEWRPKPAPWMPPDWDESVVWAVRQMAEGRANDGQQKLVWDWLMYVTAASEEFADLSFRPGEEGRRATDFAEGKRFVGMQVRKMLHPALTPAPTEPDPEPAPVKRPRRASPKKKKPATRKPRKR